MSLINEALKRARQAQTQPAPVRHTEAPLEPVVKRARKAPPWLPAAASVGILLLGIWFIGLWWRSAESVATPAPVHDPTADADQAAMAIAAQFAAKAAQSKPAPPPLPVFVGASESSVSIQPASPPVQSTLPKASTPAPAPASASDPLTSASPASPTDSPPALPTAREPQSHETATAAPPANPTAPFKLQGIFFRLNKASVLINNQTLYVGDEIEGAKVLKIERHAVQLQIAGKAHVLKLR